ncbi:MAG: hypothetical protein DSY33_02505 [Archaeoglobus sp.]|nr:MAG: hypothetical protein DSY33_02505 [Archaeoglobus sp.]
MTEYKFKHSVEIIDVPEEYTFSDFARNLAAMDVDTVYYFDGRLYHIDYEVTDAVVEKCLTVVEVITSVSFCNVSEYRKWILYHGNDDEAEYVSKIKKIRGDTVIIHVLKSENRFIRKVNELINSGKYKSFC